MTSGRPPRFISRFLCYPLIKLKCRLSRDAATPHLCACHQVHIEGWNIGKLYSIETLNACNSRSHHALKPSCIQIAWIEESQGEIRPPLKYTSRSVYHAQLSIKMGAQIKCLEEPIPSVKFSFKHLCCSAGLYLEAFEYSH